MAPTISDRILWLGAGFVLFAVAKGVAYGLRRIVDINTIVTSEATSPREPRPEDSISINTLKTLIESPNTEIRNATILLLMKRLIATPQARDAYMDDFFSPSAEVRRKATQLDDLFWNFNIHTSSPAILEDFSWLIDITRKSESDGARTIRAAYKHIRDTATAQNMSQLTMFHVLAMAMKITRDQRVIICPDMTREQVRPWLKAMQALLTGKSASRDAAVAEALHLLNNPSLEDGPEDWEDGLPSKATSTGGYNIGFSCAESQANWLTSNTPFARAIGEIVTSQRGNPIFREESPEEVEVRRRRREAMVLHEGSGMLDRNDIIQPDNIEVL